MLPDLRVWLNHFEYHAQHPRCIPSGLPDVLTGEERRRIADSLAIFQLGEHSRGRALAAATRRFAHRRACPELERIMELFIREERRHAELLRDFMTDHCIPVRKHAWTDTLFRGLRRLAGLELYLHVLVGAELIGNAYYRGLERATGCKRLNVLCRTLVADELAHIGFESELLRELQTKRTAAVRSFIRTLHRASFTCAALFVWTTHRGVLRESGFGAMAFVRTCRAQYAFHLDSASAAERQGHPTPS